MQHIGQTLQILLFGTVFYDTMQVDIGNKVIENFYCESAPKRPTFRHKGIFYFSKSDFSEGIQLSIIHYQL